MKKIFSGLFILAALAGLFTASRPIWAFDTTGLQNQLEAAGGASGAGFGKPTDPRVTAFKIIKVAFSFLGTIFICLTLYAGFLWMTAGGNEDNLEKAKKLLTQTVVGLIIILSAYSITFLAFRVASGGSTDGSDRWQPTFTW